MKKVIKGYAGAICGNELYVDTEEGVQKIKFKDRKKAWGFYCNDIIITIEINEQT